MRSGWLRRRGAAHEPADRPAAQPATAGVGLFAEAAAAQGSPVHQVDWRPPMAGTEADLATVLADPRRQPANAEALRRIVGTEAMLVDVLPAGAALRLGPADFLHAGPPIEWDRASGPLRGALLGAAALEGVVDQPEQAEQLFASGTGYTLRPVPPPLGGRPDGRRGVAVDVVVRGARIRPPAGGPTAA